MLFVHSTSPDDRNLALYEGEEIQNLVNHIRENILDLNVPFDITQMTLAMAPFLLPWREQNPKLFKLNIYSSTTMDCSWTRVQSQLAMNRRGVPDRPYLTILHPRIRTSYKTCFEAMPPMDAKEKSLVTLLTVDPYHLVRLAQSGTDDNWVIITNKLSNEFLLRISYLLGYLFPSMNNPLAQELIPMIQQQNDAEFVSRILAYAKEFLKDARRRNIMQNIEAAVGQINSQRKVQLEAQVKLNANQVEGLANRYAEALREYKQAQINFNAFTQEGGDGNVTALIEYIKRVPHIEDAKATAIGKVQFTFSMPCSNYDPDMIQHLIKPNKERPTYFTRNSLALQRIFIDERYRLYIGSMLEIDFMNCNVKRADNYDSCNYTYGLPSPHFYDFDCWGMNKKPIYDAIHRGDYLIAFTQILSTAGNLNFSESDNMRRMFERAEEHRTRFNKPCVEIAPGVFKTWKQYLTYIEQGEPGYEDAVTRTDTTAGTAEHPDNPA